MSQADDIRQAAKELRRFAPRLMHQAVGGDYSTMNKTLRRLVRTGYLAKRCRGIYELNDDPPRREASAGQKRLWRLMKMRPRFTVAELAMLAELNQKYARGYFVFLKNQGHIIQVGRERHPNGKNLVPVYALKAESRNRSAPPFRKPRARVEAKELARQQCLKTALSVVRQIREGRGAGVIRESGLILDAQLKTLGELQLNGGDRA